MFPSVVATSRNKCNLEVMLVIRGGGDPFKLQDKQCLPKIFNAEF